MKWNTPIVIEAQKGYLQHGKPMLLMGSCFAESMGEYLSMAKFDIDINPFGTLYNPESIAVALHRLIENRCYTEGELRHDGELWYSYHHHGKFSRTASSAALQAINERYKKVADNLPSCQRLIITWGTAYVYRLNENGETVANCHKQPASKFTRTRLSVEEIIVCWRDLLHKIENVAPDCRVLFTVSPIRHLRDGAHDNQLSKSTLLLAADALCKEFPELCSYFPSYEIVLDELRDYRFYAEDMTHPSAQAIAYIRERMTEAYFTPETQQIADTCEKIYRSMQHRPLNGRNNAAYRRFAENLLQQMAETEAKYPFIAFDNERNILNSYLQTT